MPSFSESPSSSSSAWPSILFSGVSYRRISCSTELPFASRTPDEGNAGRMRDAVGTEVGDDMVSCRQGMTRSLKTASCSMTCSIGPSDRRLVTCYVEQAMVREHDVVALTEDRPTDGLHRGDVGAIVHCYPGADAYEVEFID